MRHGGRLADQAGATMQEVVESIRRVAGLMGEITVASQEQSAGIEQIHDAVSQMDQVTQQNAAMVEEAAGAAQSLQDQAAGLARLVSVFRLGGAAPAHAGLQAQAQAPRPVAVRHGAVRPSLTAA